MRSKCHPGPPARSLPSPRAGNLLSLYLSWISLPYRPSIVRCRTKTRTHAFYREIARLLIGASVIDILENSKIRRDSVKRMIQIQKTSYSFAATKYFSVAAREHTLAPPGRHRPRHSRMSLTSCQNTPAIDAAIHRPDRTLYQLQPSFHTQSTEPEPTARARRAGEEFY